jgi:pilus assembly protein CpaE
MRLTFITYSEDPGRQQLIAEQLEGSDRVEIVGEFSTFHEFKEAVRTQRPDGAYLDVGTDPARCAELVHGMPEPGPALLMGGSREDAQILREAMRLGALDYYLNHDMNGQLDAAFNRIESLSPQRPKREGPQPVLAVVGAKGGVGTTLVACELAASLQRLGERTAVLDLNLHLGDVAMYFDLMPDYSIADVAKKGEQLDPNFMRTIAARHSTGVNVVAAPPLLEEVGLIGPTHVGSAIDLLRREFDRVILDISRPWDEVSLRGLDAADAIMIVTTAEVPSLSHTRHHLELFEQLGVDHEQVRLVLNRYKAGSTLGPREIQAFLGRGPDLTIPEDTLATSMSTNEGRVLHAVAQDTKIDRSFRQLAELSYQWCDLELPRWAASPTLANRVLRYILRR